MTWQSMADRAIQRNNNYPHQVKVKRYISKVRASDIPMMQRIVEVVEKYEHRAFIGYREAHDEGWIATVEQHGMCLRFNPETVTKAALKTAIRRVAKSEEDEFHLSDMFCCDFEGATEGIDRRGMLNMLRGVMDGTLKLEATC